MHEPINSQTEASSEAEFSALLDARIVQALESAPLPEIPADFAARVVERLPGTRPVSLTVTHYGRTMMRLSIVVLLAVLVLLAAHNSPHRMLEVALEWLFFAQFTALAVWSATAARN